MIVVHIILKNVWNNEISTLVMLCTASEGLRINNINAAVPNMTAPAILNKRCIHAALFAFRVVPALDIIAVTHEPIFCPNVINTAALVVTTPLMASVCNIPTEADELCKSAVTIIPISIPSKGLLPTTSNAFENIGASVYGDIDCDIKLKPKNKRPIPTIISPTIFFFGFLLNKTRIAPIPTSRGA